jgi:protein-disulfide isomerase
MATRNTSTITETEVSTASDFTLTNVLIIIVILLNALGLYLLTGNSLSLSNSDKSIDTFGIKKAVLEVEYDKVGWKKNYDLINQATLIQMKEQIPQIEKFLSTQGGSVPDTATTGSTTTTTIPVLTPDEIATLKKDAVIEWNSGATITLIEYSEMECPFCAQQYHDTQLSKKLKAQYGDTVNFAYKSNRGVNHPGTEKKALGLLCAGKVGGDAAYVKFYTYVMDNTTLRPQKRDGTIISADDLAQAATAAGVDVAKWQACVDTKATLPDFTRQTSEAQKYGLGGTPGTLIFNSTTGKYTTIEGAYPYESFVAKIEELMK